MKASASNPVFHAQGVTKSYQMGEVQVHALRGIDLDLYESECVAVLDVWWVRHLPVELAELSEYSESPFNIVEAVVAEWHIEVSMIIWFISSPTTRCASMS
ncbi:hypothetical protein [Marinobacterium weihaiense]|uniref:Uncharacterized protein n=1 Tax=Marinobacterium weihaiense TaxID=2851016 RepID=A0ABS6MC65_9GAMM|nr:hypothetical protein [Marinobacterium weihaiense]MBV0933897.1 hypothetical protein [Marinobacterium weihaiense]